MKAAGKSAVVGGVVLAAIEGLSLLLVSFAIPYRYSLRQPLTSSSIEYL